MGVRFIHAADLHLGSPLKGALGDAGNRGELLKRATEEALEHIIDLALDQSVDFVVVSGDLFDERARSVEANEFLIDQFGRLDAEGIPCYIIHGNHDPLYENAERLAWPENVHVFPADDVETVHFPNDERPAARLLGQSYGQQWESNAIYWHYTPADRSVPNIGLLHTGLNPDGNRYAPAAPSDLAKKDIDYWALGHIHTPGRVNGAAAAYAGIPQGRHAGEADVGGCYLVEADANAEPELEFFPTSPVVWQELAIDIGADDSEEITTLDRLTARITERIQSCRNDSYDALAGDSLDVDIADVPWSPEGFVFRLELTGRGEIYDQLDEEALNYLRREVRERLPGGTPVVWIEAIRDHTSPPLPSVEELRKEDETIDTLHTLVADLRSDEDARRALRDEVGEVWQWTTAEEREDVPETSLALDEERLDELIDRALQQATTKLALQHSTED